MKFFLSTLCVLLISEFAFSQPIIIDENPADWDEISTLYSDGDDDFSPINFGDFKMWHDDRFLYFYLEVGSEINIQDDNNITLYIDTDNEITTGFTLDEIGYDLEYKFGQRTGAVHRTNTTTINSYRIGLTTAPTVTSTWFEFKIDLDTEINGIPIFQDSTIAIVLKNGSGDQLPEKQEILTYTLSETPPFASSNYQISKPQGADLRVLSYNVRRDDLFDPAKESNFRRLIQAVDPDIIGFQEIYTKTGEQTAELIEDFIPSEEGEQWYFGYTGNDNIMVSRYPVVNQVSILGNAAFLLDMGDHHMLAIVAHPPCCSNGNAGRQLEIDAIMAFVRDSKEGLKFDIAEKTPIIVMGDMNLVGLARQQQTLLTGDIFDEVNHGPDFAPDWDGTAFDDAKPVNPGLPTTFTWYSSGSSFSAGRLDYIVYTGASIELQNAYSLFTPSLPADSLTQYDLEEDDSILASDHLPMVADFSILNLSSNESLLETPKTIRLDQNYPNPFNPSTNISFELEKPTKISLTIHSVSGREIARLISNSTYPSGRFTQYFDASEFASGVYFYRLQAGNEIITRKMVLIK